MILVIWKSADGLTWQHVRDELIPDFVNTPAKMARMAAGEKVMDLTGFWYAAQKILEASDG